MSQHTACQTLTVGQSEYCSITQCPDCRMYHLHIGPLSLRLREEVFENICGALSSIYREHYGHKEQVNISVHSH